MATSRPVTPHRVDGRHQARSRGSITLSDGEGHGEHAPSRLIKTLGRRCSLAGMAVSQVVALRGPGRLVLEPPAACCWAWLSNDVLARRGLAVAWLKRGASASDDSGI